MPTRRAVKPTTVVPITTPLNISALAREHGKEFLRQGQFAAAKREFARARHGISSWKLRIASLGLHLAPALLRRLYLSRVNTYGASAAAVREQ